MRSLRPSILMLGLAAIALGLGLLSALDPEAPNVVVKEFLQALLRGDTAGVSSLVDGVTHPTKTVERQEVASQGIVGPVSRNPFEINLELVSQTSSQARVLAHVRNAGAELTPEFALVYYRGVGWKIRSIDGARIRPATVLAELRGDLPRQGALEFVDQDLLKRKLEEKFSAQRQPVQMATEPKSAPRH